MDALVKVQSGSFTLAISNRSNVMYRTGLNGDVRKVEEEEGRMVPRDHKLQTPLRWIPPVPVAVLLSTLSRRVLHLPKTAELELLKKVQLLAQAHGALNHPSPLRLQNCHCQQQPHCPAGNRRCPLLPTV